MSNYSKIGNFGKDIAVNLNEGIAMCLLDEGPMTRSSNGPATANRLGPASPLCQAFMAEYCANKWDKYCDIYYKKNATESIRAFPNTFAVRSAQFSDNVGDSLLKNAAQLRFFKTDCNATYKEPLDPTNYSSPMVTRFLNQRSMDGAQLNTRTMNARSIDKDPLMQRMLANPNAVQQELKAIHSLSRSSGFQRSGGGNLNQTSTGKILNQYFGN